jgi:hypothetical protein
MNPNDATTKLFVTPTGGYEFEDIGGVDRDQRRGNWNARVQLCRFPEREGSDEPYTGDCTGGGIWNNEEGGFSFTVKKNVVCTTADNIVDFFGGAGTSAYTQWVASGKAGWAYLVTHWGNINDRDGVDAFLGTDQAILGKLEYGTGLSWDGSIEDTINNFVWLRDNSQLLELCSAYGRCAATAGINIIHNEYAGQELGACCYTNAGNDCDDYFTEDFCFNSLGGYEWYEGETCSQITCPTAP